MTAADEFPRLLLLADSDAGWSVATGAGLQARGWSIAWAAGAETAASAARRTLPDVVIVDADLDGDALRLLRRLRATAATALTPAIALADDDRLQPSLEDAGAQVVLRKPVTVDDLHAAARAALDAEVTVSAPPAALLADPERIALLDASGLLTVDRDELLDHITATAAALLPAASARITVVAGDHQVVASRTDRLGPSGQDPDRRRSTPLTHSLCQWAVAAQEPLVVGDARADPLLATNKGVTELGAVAYLGAPLVVTGQALGTLCVLDDRPRDWEPDHLDLLESLAAAAAAHVRVRLAATDGGAARNAAADAVVALASVLQRNLDAAVGEALAGLAAALAHFAELLHAPRGR